MKLKPQFREFEVKGVDKENRTVELSFSSEDPYERYWGVEILDHSTTSVDMERLNNSAPLLFNHDRDIVIGVVESAKIEAKRGVSVVRFGNSAKAQEIFSDVVDGIMKNVSVGYQIDEMKLESEREGMETYRVTKWQPFEISVVSIPADATVGIGRSDEELKLNQVTILNQKNKEIGMTPEEKRALEERQASELATAKADMKKQEKMRVKEITAIGLKHDMGNEAAKAIDDDSSLDEFRALVLNNLQAKSKITQIDSKAGDIMSANEIKQYSFGRALQAAITGDWTNAGLEREASNQVAKMLGKDSRGFFVPHQVLQRDISTTTNGASNIIQTTTGGASFIDILRNKLVIAKLGGQVLSGLQGNIAIPKQIGTATAYWIEEGANTTASDLSLGLIQLTPKTVSAKSGYTRQMLLQGNPEIESLVMNDLAANIALAIDKAAISGTGADGQPLGILNTTGIGAVDCSAGLSWAKVVEFQTKMDVENIETNNLHYIAGAEVAGKLKTTQKENGTGRYLLEDNRVNGFNYHTSNQVGANTMLLGDFSQLITGLWGGLDIMVDPYEKADSGGIVIRAFQSVDIGVRYAQAFSATKNIDQ